MKLILALITALILLAGIGLYFIYPVGELAWVDGPYKEYKNVRTRLNYKALAIDRKAKKYGRGVSFPAPEAAIEQALYDCRKIAKNCELYAVGNDIVLGATKQRVVNLYEAMWAKTTTRVFKSPWDGRTLKGPEIKRVLSGMNAIGITLNGLRIRLTWKGTGDLGGDVLNNFTNPPRKDQGKWWVQGDQLCRQYNNWYSGQKMCGPLKLDDSDYLIYNEVGRLMVIFKPVGI